MDKYIGFFEGILDKVDAFKKVFAEIEPVSIFSWNIEIIRNL